MSEPESTNDVAALAVQLLSVYLANNTVASEDLAGLIRTTKEALGAAQEAAAPAEPDKVTPAVSVRKSLASPDFIISLIDGKSYKTLKRHLMAHGLTPDDYRARYNLPKSYPMVAPTYAEHRRAVAQRTGLGGRKRQAVPAAEAPGSSEDQLEGAVIADAAVADAGAATPAAEPQKKPRRAAVAKKASDGRRAKSKDAGEAPAAPAPDVALPTPADDVAEIEQVADIATSAPESAPEKPAKRATRGRPPKTTEAKAPVSGRRKAKTRTEESAVAAADGPSGDAAAQKSKRRSTLGLFKKSESEPDATAQATSSDGSEPAPQVAEPVSEAPSADAPDASAKGRGRKRTAR